MSDNIPFELQLEIVKWLPVKSLLRFRSVSKDWKHLIDSPTFIAQFNTRNHTKPQHLLVRYDYNDDPIDNEQKYISLVDDDTFPKHKTSVTIPLSVNLLNNSSIIGISQGLVCLYGDYRWGRPESGRGRAVIWNPSVRKSVSVVVPNAAYGLRTIWGFGVCRETNDPKIVKITCIDSSRKLIKSFPGQVEVFRLSTGVWRNQYNNLPCKSIRIVDEKEALDGFVYWLATDGEHTTNLGEHTTNLIISFDMTSEEFSEIALPDSLAHNSEYNLSMSKVIESLVVLETDVEAEDRFFSVWMMQDSAKKCFTKLYTISTVYTTVNVSCFRTTGEPILTVVDDSNGVTAELVVYDPGSKRITNLGIKGDDVLFFVYPYMETLHLHLLHQPAFISCDKGKQCSSRWSGKRRRPYYK